MPRRLPKKTPKTRRRTIPAPTPSPTPTEPGLRVEERLHLLRNASLSGGLVLPHRIYNQFLAEGEHVFSKIPPTFQITDESGRQVYGGIDHFESNRDYDYSLAISPWLLSHLNATEGSPVQVQLVHRVERVGRIQLSPLTTTMAHHDETGTDPREALERFMRGCTVIFAPSTFKLPEGGILTIQKLWDEAGRPIRVGLVVGVEPSVTIT